MAPTTDKTKSFVINHMNADHQESLALYLQVYCRVSASDAKHSRLEDVSLTDLLISAKGTRYSVPVHPPMNSYADARPRVVAMHQECLQRLGLSDIRINAYQAPRGFVQTLVFGVCLATYVGFSRRGNFLPGSVLYETLRLDRVSGFARFCYDVQPILLPLMVGIHLVEASLLAVKRLKRHRVSAFSGVWWAWMVSCFIEGFGAFQRIDGMVREERRKRESKSH